MRACVQLASTYNCTLALALLPLPDAATSAGVATSDERHASLPATTAHLSSEIADGLADVGTAGFGLRVTPRPSLSPKGETIPTGMAD